jgi:hypothetical protein
MMKKIPLLLVLSAFALASKIDTKPIESSLVIYNSNLALVNETNLLELSKDDTNIIYENVADSIINESVNISLPTNVELFSQQFRYDKISLNKMLQANIGKEIMYKNQYVTLLSSSPVLIKYDNDIIKSINDVENISFSKIPSELLLKPSLIWNVKSSDDIEDKIELSYLIKNIDWKSNYTLHVEQDKASLNGWISINNRSSKRFDNIDLNVMAGDVNLVKEVQPRIMYKSAMMMADNSVQERSFEGYHLYSVPFKVTLAAREKTQIRYLDINDIEIKRVYKASMSHPFYVRKKVDKKVSQFIKTDNIAYPLPSGVIRVYSSFENKDIFVGEQSIKHTPKNEKLSLNIGNNFDVKASEELVELYDDKEYDYISVEYVVKNSSDDNKSVELNIPYLVNKSNTLKSTQNFTKKNGGMISFDIDVEQNSQKEFIVEYKKKKTEANKPK